MRNVHYEADDKAWQGDAYTARGWAGIAWRVLGWETEPDEDTEWSGQEQRTGFVVGHMVGDDALHRFEPADLTVLDREEYCSVCGQVGCAHDGLARRFKLDNAENL